MTERNKKQLRLFTNITLYVLLWCLALYSRNQDGQYGSVYTGALFGILTFVPVFPFVYGAWRFVRRYKVSRNIIVAWEDAWWFIKLWFSSLLFMELSLKDPLSKTDRSNKNKRKQKLPKRTQ